MDREEFIKMIKRQVCLSYLVTLGNHECWLIFLINLASYIMERYFIRWLPSIIFISHHFFYLPINRNNSFLYHFFSLFFFFLYLLNLLKHSVKISPPIQTCSTKVEIITLHKYIIRLTLQENCVLASKF
jgi:hypothetical protein